MIKNLKVVKLVIVKNMVFKKSANTKIIKFTKKPDGLLSDEDINALMFGLLNLIKNNAVKKVEQFYKKEVAYYQDLLNLNLSKVVKLEREIKK